MIRKPLRRLLSGLCFGLLAFPAAATADDPTPAQPLPSPVLSLGALTALTPDTVRAAVSLVRDGKVYSLAQVTGPQTPAYPGRGFSLFVKPIMEDGKTVQGSNQISGHDDTVCTALGIGTQIDGLGHVGINGVHYGGVRAETIWRPEGLVGYGVENIPPIVGRAVLIDMVAAKGNFLAAGEAVTAEDLKQALKRQGMALRPGDIALIRTGWLEQDLTPAAFMAGEPGIDLSGAAYLAEQGVVAVGADNWAVEAIGGHHGGNGAVFPVHQQLLARHGIFILENIKLDSLAADKAYESLFVAAPPRLQGAVQAILQPVAIR